MNFKSDNIAPIHPHILKAISDANTGLQNSYGDDEYSNALKEKISQIFEKDVEIFLVSTGSISNCLALSSLCLPYQTIYCHKNAHINTHEAGCIESMGYKLTPVDGSDNKIDLCTLKLAKETQLLYAPHMVKPGAISLTQPTEIGTVYTLDEIKKLKQLELPIHMDGARFSNALAYLGVSPKEMIQHIDVLSLGGTKNGCMIGELVVFFNKDYAKDFSYRVKRAGQLLSKTRYVAAQMIAYFDVWIENAQHANKQAKKLFDILSQNFKPAYPIETNQVFFHMDIKNAQKLQEAGVKFYHWEKDIYRFVTHFMTTDEKINQLQRLINS
ncbi:MAG: low specificity L-threonine aldolase [Alphaproteobacteria bacterium]|nr:MAG: low specificity L-threonine aldolase [Alphaproteobacteria bacterium]